jgi:hypothetical protein
MLAAMRTANQRERKAGTRCDAIGLAHSNQRKV